MAYPTSGKTKQEPMIPGKISTSQGKEGAGLGLEDKLRENFVTEGGMEGNTGDGKEKIVEGFNTGKLIDGFVK